MLQLPNGCSCSDPSVHPSNWKKGGKDLLNKKWYIQYWFRDPAQSDEWKKKYPYGKLIIVKNMNKVNLCTSMEEKRSVTKLVLDNEIALLAEGYNPVTKKIVAVNKGREEIHKDLYWIDACKMAVENLKCSKDTKTDIKSTIATMEIVGVKLGYGDLKISEVKTKKATALFSRLRNDYPAMSSHRFNKHRSFLMMLFKELLRWEACEYDPIEQVPKENQVTTHREPISIEERRLIDQHLRKKKLTAFRLYLRIFFHSGARHSELFALQANKVNLQQQWFKVIIKKGGQLVEAKKTIPDTAVRYWKLLIKNASASDYLFSKGLVPGPDHIDEAQLSRRWNRHIKKDLGIQIDSYTLKHTNTTEISDSVPDFRAGQQLAADQNSHTSTAMVVSIYDTKSEKRKHEALKKIINNFS